jgi:hypothetical protein
MAQVNTGTTVCFLACKRLKPKFIGGSKSLFALGKNGVGHYPATLIF